jgi:hypothetical protein
MHWVLDLHIIISSNVIFFIQKTFDNLTHFIINVCEYVKTFKQHENMELYVH